MEGGPRPGATTWSCPIRWGPRAARSRRSRRRDRPRQVRETVRACRRPNEGERSANGLRNTGAVFAKSTNGVPVRRTGSAGREGARDEANSRRYPRAVRRTIAAIGRTLVTLGLLILLFVAYQLWGTGIYTAQAQDRLKSDFKKEQAKYEEQDTVAPPTTGAGGTRTTVPGPTTSTTQPVRKGAPPPTPPEGEVEGLISIPAIGLHLAYVEGTDVPDLRKGPGHYPDTPIPGSLGNAAIAGHRTTYLHP